MDEAAALLLTYVLAALGFSFLCSVAEAVLLSVTPSFIEGLKEGRPRRAALLARLRLKEVNRSLAAILTLNTVAHTAGAIGAGAKAAEVFGSTWFGVFSGAMTLAILFLTEIVPKTLGAIHWARLAWPTALFVRSLIVILFPVVWIAERLTKLIARGKVAAVFSRDEFIAMSRVGERSGQIRNEESRVIRNLFRLDSMMVRDIMTPRTVVSALDENATMRDAVQHAIRAPFSRLPVYGTGIDDITGFVLRDDILLGNTAGRHEEPVRSVRREILRVPETASLSVLLQRFLSTRQHIAVALDEYGGTRGLVTLEDLVETLLGVEILDEMDNVEDMRALARRLWKERAKTLGIDGHG